jgi:hypothetical protein
MHSLKTSLFDVLDAVESLHEKPSKEGVPFIDASPLRTMQRDLEALLFNGRLQEQEWIIAYALYCLIDSAFYNMSGDVTTDDEASKVQVEFFRRFVPYCKSVQSGLGQQDFSKSTLSLSELVEDFFATMNQLNQP